MQPMYSILVALVLIGPPMCGVATTPDPQPSLVQIDPRLVNAYTSFGLDLFLRVTEDAGAENVFLSPSSVAFSLAMTYHGAAGETRDAIAQSLGIAAMSPEEVARANAAWREALADPDSEVVLSVANSLWARQGIPFEPAFLELNRQYYGATVETLDFGDPAASRTINGWVSESTDGKIDEIVPPQIDPRAVLYLINAIYFKGLWADPFNPDRTRDGEFTLPDGSVKSHPMMSRRGSYGVLDGEGFQAIRLPYGSGRLAMYVFLPDRGSSLEAFYGGLEATRWEQWISEFREQDVLLVLPRFRVEYEVNLNEALKALGMEIAFDPARANFAGMLPQAFLAASNAYISNVKHRTLVEVNEEGTEAAAATSVEISVVSAPPSFVVDRPFFAAIRDDETGTILFMGQVVDPR